MVLNEGFCTIYKGKDPQGLGAFVDIESQKKKFRTKCACIVPDNIIKLNEFLCSKGQSEKYTGEITILEAGKQVRKSFDIVKLLYYDTTLGICCYEVNVKKKGLRRYSRTFYRYGVTGAHYKNIFAFKGSAEEFILKNFGQQKEDILPVEILITENEKDGLGHGSYPVFMKMVHEAGYFYQLIGFLALRKGTECDLLLCTNLKKALSCEGTSFEGQSLFDRFMEDRKKEHQQPNNDEKQDQGTQSEEKQPEKKTSAENRDEQGDGRGKDLPLANEPAGPKEKVNIPLEEEENAAYLEQERAEGLENQQESRRDTVQEGVGQQLNTQDQSFVGGLENQQDYSEIQSSQELSDQQHVRQDLGKGLENQQESRRNTVQEDVGQRLNLQEQHFVGGLENQQDYTEIQSSQKRPGQQQNTQDQPSGVGLENQQDYTEIQSSQERPGQQQNTQDQPSGVGLENQQESRRETVKEPQRPEDLEARHGQQQDRVVKSGDGGKQVDDRNVELSLPKQPAYIGIESDYASTCVIDHHAREIVAKLIGDSWRELARNLPWHIKPIFVNAKIQNIHAEFPNSQYEAAHKVFSEWHGDQGDGATLEKLRYTLIKIGKQHIAKELAAKCL